MPLPSSGTISISDINTELGRTSNTANSNFAGGTTPQTGSLFKLGETGCINQTASHKMSEWYGYPFCSPATDLGFTIGEIYLNRTSPNNMNDYRIGYANSTLNLNSTSYTAGGVSSHGSLTNTTPSQLDGNTITAVGVRYRTESVWRANIDTDGDGYVDTYFQEVYLYVKGTSTAISTWSSLTFTGDATSSGSGYAYYVNTSSPKNLDIKIAQSQPAPNVGAIITGSGVPSNTKITTVQLLDSPFVDPQRWAFKVDKNCTPTLNNTYSYGGISTQTNTYNRTSATLNTGTFAYGGGSSTDGFLLYKWTSNLGSVDDGGISLAKYFQGGIGSLNSVEITIS